MAGDSKTDLERELMEVFIAALRKGMTAEEFFAMAETTLEHLRGKAPNETIEKIMSGSATPEDVTRMLSTISKTGNG